MFRSGELPDPLSGGCDGRLRELERQALEVEGLAEEVGAQRLGAAVERVLRVSSKLLHVIIPL